MKIAIIGAGITGLAAAYKLHRRHDVTVYEAEARIGGHTATIDVEHGGRQYAIDTGFIVFNDWTYPNFIGLIDELGVASQPTEMSFSVHSELNGLEYVIGFGVLWAAYSVAWIVSRVRGERRVLIFPDRVFHC